MSTTWLGVGGAGIDQHTIIRSTDFSTWSSIPSTSIQGIRWSRGNSVAHNGSTWVVAGDGANGWYDQNAPVIYSQDDGLTWQRATVPSDITNGRLTFVGTKVKWNGTVFMMGGEISVLDSGVAMTPILQSTDGITWTAATGAGQSGNPGHWQTVYDVNWIDGSWCACGWRASGGTRYRNELLVAGSGTNPTWTKIIMNNSLLSTTVPYKIAGTTQHKIFIILLDSAGQMIYSTDGTDWSNTTSVPLSGSANDLFQNSDSQVIMVGQGSSGPIVYTTNFSTWTQSTNSSLIGTGTAVYGKGSNFLAAGLGSDIIKSTDSGHTWSLTTISSSVKLGIVNGFGATYSVSGGN